MTGFNHFFLVLLTIFLGILLLAPVHLPDEVSIFFSDNHSAGFPNQIQHSNHYTTLTLTLVTPFVISSHSVKDGFLRTLTLKE